MTDYERVMVSLTGNVNEEIQENVSEGRYRYENGTHYVYYDSGRDDFEVKNLIKIMDKRIEVVRRGGIVSKMVFAPGASHDLDYSTPFGKIKMTIHTLGVSVTDTGTEINAEIDYNLDSDGRSVSSNNNMLIRIQRAVGC